ncbi:hypothetical protein OG937_10630 [Streptomyces sp. NBC_00510]
MTVHEDLAEGIWEDIRKQPEEAAAVFRVQNMHINGDLDQDVIRSAYADSLGSSARFRPARWPVYQTAAFAFLHALIGGGDVAYVPIRTGGTPCPDADRVGNAALLARTCPPFSAELDMGQNGADCDGTLRWDKTIELSRGTGAFFYQDNCRNRGQSRLECRTTYQPRSAPLEATPFS